MIGFYQKNQSSLDFSLQNVVGVLYDAQLLLYYNAYHAVIMFMFFLGFQAMALSHGNEGKT